MTDWKISHQHKNKYRDDEIPCDFDDFVRDFGGIEHPTEIDNYTKSPKMITKFTPYQSYFAKLDWGVALKANKAGLTSSELLRDFHTRLLPEYAGSICLFQSGSQELANMLLASLEDKIKKSKKYRKFLITNFDQNDRLLILNPYHNSNSMILACDCSLRGDYNRMDVSRVHLSDPARMEVIAQDDYFAGLVSRLHNMSGQFKIEGVPGPRSGWFWKLWQALHHEDAENHTRCNCNNDYLTDYEFPKEIIRNFTAVKITIDEAVVCGVISNQQRAFLKASLTPELYRRTCMAEFPQKEEHVFQSPNTYGDHTAKWADPPCDLCERAKRDMCRRHRKANNRASEITKAQVIASAKLIVELDRDSQILALRETINRFDKMLAEAKKILE